MRCLLLILFATACGTRSEASPPRAQPLAENHIDAGTDAILPPEAKMPDAGLLLDSGKPM
jgi:hypothetical protein